MQRPTAPRAHHTVRPFARLLAYSRDIFMTPAHAPLIPAIAICMHTQRQAAQAPARLASMAALTLRRPPAMSATRRAAAGCCSAGTPNSARSRWPTTAAAAATLSAMACQGLRCGMRSWNATSSRRPCAGPRARALSGVCRRALLPHAARRAHTAHARWRAPGGWVRPQAAPGQPAEAYVRGGSDCGCAAPRLPQPLRRAPAAARGQRRCAAGRQNSAQAPCMECKRRSAQGPQAGPAKACGVNMAGQWHVGSTASALTSPHEVHTAHA